MDLNKMKLDDIIEEKRKEIKKLNKKINRLKEDIQQIEKENWITLNEPVKNNHTFKKVIQLLKN